MMILLSLGTPGFGSIAHARMDPAPTRGDACPVVVLYESEGRVPELDKRPSVRLAEAVLHIRDDRIGHEQRTGDFEQRRTADGLHVSPEMAVIAAQVAVPPAARPGLDLHRHGLAIACFIVRSDLFEQRGKGRFERGADVNFLCDVQDQILDGLFCEVHDFSLFILKGTWGSLSGGSLFRSARSLTRFN